MLANGQYSSNWTNYGEFSLISIRFVLLGTLALLYAELYELSLSLVSKRTCASRFSKSKAGRRAGKSCMD